MTLRPHRMTTATLALGLALLTLGTPPAGAAPTPGGTTPASAAAADPPAVTVKTLDLAGVDGGSLKSLPSVAPQPADDAAGPASGPADRARVARPAAPPPAPSVLTSELAVAPFSVMGVTWDPTASDVVIRYRVRQAGVWTPWAAVGTSDVAPDRGSKDPTGHRAATDPIVAVGADGLQLWAQASQGAVSGLKVVLIDPGHSPLDSAVAQQSSALRSGGGAAGGRGAGLSTTVTGVPAAAAPAPPIIRRSQWGADESMRTCEPDLAGATLAAAVHHTASTNDYTADDVPGILRGILAFHTRPEAAGGRGWCDIGYNFLVDKFGRIFEGRAGSIEQAVIGVHTGGFNSRTLGVAAIGEYGAVAPSAALLEGLSQVIAWKFATHRILANSFVTMVSGGGASKYPEGTSVTFSTIYGHRDAQQTSCPGQRLYDALQAIRDRVAALSNAAVVVSPTGNVEVLRAGLTDITVSGWVLDPDTTDPIRVQVLVDDGSTFVQADRDRPDLAPYFPGAGTRHGFSVRVPAAPGPHAVCVWAQNVGGGNDLLMGCQRMTVGSKAPVGSIDTVSTAVGAISVVGWALDPDTTDPIQVHLYVDGAAVRGVVADLSRPDIGAAYGDGDRHGFAQTLPTTPGAHSVCAYAIDSSLTGPNPQIGCRTVTVPAAAPNHAPIGNIDTLTSTSTSLTVAGWALDPDTTDPIQVHIYLDGHAVLGTYASIPRTDVGAAYGKGDNHGYTITIPATPGTHTLCAYAIDSSLTGPNPQIGCRTTTITNHAPIGTLDAVKGAAGSVTAAGWALDPDTTQPIQVHVYVDGTARVGVLADATRTDVGAAFRLGDKHGFVVTVPVAAGGHTVCVYAIDTTPAGPNPQLGCLRAVAG